MRWLDTRRHTSLLSLLVIFISAIRPLAFFPLFFFNDTATTEIYTLSLHDALPILLAGQDRYHPDGSISAIVNSSRYATFPVDRKSTRLNSSHQIISYAVFCLKKKKKKKRNNREK